MAARGCGDARSQGGIYIVCPLSEHGKELEYFIVDPPIPVDTETMGIHALGVTLAQIGETWHVIDWVGESHYPNVLDFLFEVRALGLSRKVSRNLDFAKLTRESRILIVHRRAHIENAADYQKERVRIECIPSRNLWCPKHIEEHEHLLFGAMCAGLWHEDVTEGSEGPREFGMPPNERLVLRNMPAFSYMGYTKPEGVTPAYRPAIFASFPIVGLEIVDDPTGKTHVSALEKTATAGVPVTLVRE